MVKKQSEIKLRLIEFADYLGISRREFSTRIGKDPGYINAITGDIGSDVVKKIYITFPEMNLIWLITGEGEMIIKPPEQVTNSLVEYLQTKNHELETKNEALIRENARLQAHLETQKSETA